MKKILLLLTIILIMFPTSACSVESAAEHESRKVAEAESLENLTAETSEEPTEVSSESVENTTSVGEVSTTTSASNIATTTSNTITTTSVTNSTITVYLTVRCSKAIGYPGLSVTLPSSGYFCQDQSITINTGETVYKVLYNADVLNYIDTNIKSSFEYGKYLIGVGGLNEKDCGPESGWKYTITGNSTPLSISSVTPKNGDHIDFFYALTTSDTND